MDVDDDLRVSQPDDIAVGQLPFLHGRVVDGGAVGGVQVGQQRDLAVPPNLQVAARHTGVGQPELRVLAAADDVGALAQLVGTPAAVVELQSDGGAGRGVAALPVAACRSRRPRRAGRSRSRGGGFGVSAAGRRTVALAGRLTVTAVLGLLTVVRPAVSLPAAVTLVVAGLVGVAAALLGGAVAGLFVAGRSPAVFAVALPGGLAVAALAVARALVVAWARRRAGRGSRRAGRSRPGRSRGAGRSRAGRGSRRAGRSRLGRSRRAVRGSRRAGRSRAWSG